jgi:hypothetical protein
VEEISSPKHGPITKGLSISSPGESGAVVITAVSHSEDGLTVKQAEYWIGNDPGPGNGTQMKAIEGSFKSSRVDITASIDPSNFKPGNYQVSVRSGDVRGDWGSPQTITLTAPEPAILYVSTSPSGAELSVDGIHIGTTPISIENLTPGKHTITISKAGYEDWNEQVDVAAGGKKSVEFPLSSIPVKPATLHVNTSPSGAQLTVDGVQLGTTPLSIESITPGEHSLIISKVGYESRKEQINIASGEKKTVEYPLIQSPPDRHLWRNALVGILVAACLVIGYKIIIRPEEKAQLSVSTSPSGASLIIDGINKGRTPTAGILVAPGNHQIVVEKEGYSRAERKISVGPKEKKNLVVTLQKPRVDPTELRITTNPDKADVFVDDDRKGTTPLTLKNITPGEHSLTISKDGYEKRSEKFNIASGEKKSVEYPLTQIPIQVKATLSVNTSPSGAQLILDGTRVGNTPASIENIAPGTHSLTISKVGYENRNEQLSIASGEKKTVEYPLTQMVKETATLYVNTSPLGAYLSVDGVQSGRTPVQLRKLSTGDHVLSVVMPGYESKEEIVSLSKGEKKVIRIILVEAARPDAKKDIEDDLKEAIAAFNNSQYDVAITMCQSILRKDPNNSTARQYLQKAKEEQERAINNLLKPGSVKRIK